MVHCGLPLPRASQASFFSHVDLGNVTLRSTAISRDDTKLLRSDTAVLRNICHCRNITCSTPAIMVRLRQDGMNIRVHSRREWNPSLAPKCPMRPLVLNSVHVPDHITVYFADLADTTMHKSKSSFSIYQSPASWVRNKDAESRIRCDVGGARF
jgi:hypothetical protein